MYCKSKENNNNTNRDISIYAESNIFGYRYNVNHPFINELYLRYKKWRGFSSNFPIADAERFEFEKYVDKYFEDNKR